MSQLDAESRSHERDNAGLPDIDTSYEWVQRPVAAPSDDDLQSVLTIDTAAESVSNVGTDDLSGFGSGKITPGSERQDGFPASGRETPEAHHLDIVPPSHPLGIPHEAAVEDSAVTMVQDMYNDSALIIFPEPRSSENSNVLQVSYQLDSSEITKRGTERSSQWQRTLKQSMTKRLLDIQKPFRILYVGDDSRTHDIIQKVAQALASPSSTILDDNSGSDQSNSQLISIIRLPTFEKEPLSPQIELIPSSDLQVIIDRFTEDDYMRFSEENHGDQDLPFIRPDLAILFHSQLSGRPMQHFRQDEMFALIRSLNLPTIEISEDGEAEFATGFRPCFGHAIHMCLSGESTNINPNPLKVPIELSDFLKLDDLQLNRNIACITSRKSAPSTFLERVDTSAVLTSLTRAYEWARHVSVTAYDRLCTRFKDTSDHTSEEGRKVRFRIHVLAICAGILLVSMPIILRLIQASNNVGAPYKFEITTSSDMPPLTLTLSSPTFVENLKEEDAFVTSSGSAIPTAQTKTTHFISTTETVLPSAEPMQIQGPAEDGFRLQMSSNGRIYLVLPKALTKSWFPPSIFVEAFQDGVSINAGLSSIDAKSSQPGIFAVLIPERVEGRCVEIRVWTQAAPIIEQYFSLCSPQPPTSQEKFKELAVRLTQESMKIGAVAVKLSQEARRLGGEASRAVSESSLTLQSATTALGEHLASGQKWLRAEFGGHQRWAAKSLYELQQQASKDLIKYHGKVTRKLYKAQRKAVKEWAKASKDLAKASRELALWRDGATHALSLRVNRVRALAKYQKPGAMWKHIPTVMKDDPLTRARTRARKLWDRLPRRQCSFKSRRCGNEHRHQRR